MEFTTDMNDTESTVDLIQAADVVVSTVAEVAKKSKSRNVNLATVVSTLKSVTSEELQQSTPLVIRDLYAEATRIYNEYTDILKGS